MATVNVRELARHASRVVSDVESSKRPTFVSKHGRITAVLMAVSETELEDYVLAHAPEYVESMRDADKDLAAGDVVDAFAFYDQLGAGVDAPPAATRRTRASRAAGPRKPAKAAAKATPGRTRGTRKRR